MSLFIGQRPDPLYQAIVDAKDIGGRAIEPLLEMLEPVLRRIATRLASQCVDDAVQQARIRIWRKLHLVDVSRPGTAKAYVMKVAVSAMRDEVRQYLSQHPSTVGPIENVEIKDLSLATTDVYEFDTLLKHYLDYLEETGDFVGAHKAVGEKIGVTTARASTLFHKAARDFILNWKEEHGESNTTE